MVQAVTTHPFLPLPFFYFPSFPATIVTMTLGDKIKILLDERGWSHYKLAEKTGIPRPTITAIANDKRRPTAEYFIRLAEAFGIDVTELFVAAGYIREEWAFYDFKETPEQILDDIKLNIRRLEKMLKELRAKETREEGKDK